MKAEQIRDLETTELERQLQEMTGQLFHLRFQMRMGQMEGLKKYRGLRKDRARVETVLSARRAAAESQKG
ncbi:MAG: 50S ribosomal protein L29 [Bryobacteraceae bacterium]|jgi:large subunit ribosomal protein L29